jgi:hypothetical protein
MSPTTEKQSFSPDDEVDYNPLLGFVSPAVRIDPHTHDLPTPVVTDLRRVIEIVRDRRASRVENDLGKAAAAAE